MSFSLIIKIVNYVVFLLGIFPLFYRKGGKAHRKWGGWHYQGTVFLSIVCLLYGILIELNFLLLTASLASFYFAFTGNTIIKNKLRAQGFNISPSLKKVTTACIILSLMYTVGAVLYFKSLPQFHLILGSFILCLIIYLTTKDLLAYFAPQLPPNYKTQWLYFHIHRTFLSLLSLLILPFSFPVFITESVLIGIAIVIIITTWLYYLKQYSN
ncbi:MAG: hypothetical protein RML72_06925 [Bacteroidia bacterium]|nr:hypothetical protein [Bacteroidia bacterium]MDW8158593.1 hypothetical protein [Bacteroidia bacterium]